MTIINIIGIWLFILCTYDDSDTKCTC